MLSRYKNASFLPALAILLLSSFIVNPAMVVKPKILVFSKTLGYHHGSIPFGIEAVQKLGIENGYGVDTTTMPQSLLIPNSGSTALWYF